VMSLPTTAKSPEVSSKMSGQLCPPEQRSVSDLGPRRRKIMDDHYYSNGGCQTSFCLGIWRVKVIFTGSYLSGSCAGVAR
jgi:hypothetical protein